MKKLFFLCAFLFISMQMQAQMYVIYFDYDDSTISTPEQTPDNYRIKTVAPDGTITSETWDHPMPLADFNNFSSSVPSFYQKLQEYVNPLLEEGYRFIEPFASSNPPPVSAGEFVFFLALP